MHHTDLSTAFYHQTELLPLSILAEYFISLQFILLLSTISIFGFNIASQKTIPILINKQNIKFEIFTSGSLIISLIISIIFVLILSSMVYLEFNFLPLLDNNVHAPG